MIFKHWRIVHLENDLTLRERPDLENQVNTLGCEISVDKKKNHFFRNIIVIRIIWLGNY